MVYHIIRWNKSATGGSQGKYRWLVGENRKVKGVGKFGKLLEKFCHCICFSTPKEESKINNHYYCQPICKETTSWYKWP